MVVLLLSEENPTLNKGQVSYRQKSDVQQGEPMSAVPRRGGDLVAHDHRGVVARHHLSHRGRLEGPPGRRERRRTPLLQDG